MKRIMMFIGTAVVAILFLYILYCTKKPENADAGYHIEVVAESLHLWTGVAVSGEGSIFVNFPRWSPNIPMSVARLSVTGETIAYPDQEWNSWESDDDPANRFVCVQSVYIDADDVLWVLDAGFSIYRGGVVRNGPKLVSISLKNNEVVDVIHFDTTAAPFTSYLNDVRIDTERNYAYITDSGLGTIITVDLMTRDTHRRLVGHPSVKSEGVTLTIEGAPWLQQDGGAPDIHADGIGLDLKHDMIYYQALTGRTLYRIKGAFLRDTSLSAQELGGCVERVGQTGAADGMVFDADCTLLLTALEYNGIKKLNTDGTATLAVTDSLLKWPDSIASGPEGSWYVTASRLHISGDSSIPYRLIRIRKQKSGPEITPET